MPLSPIARTSQAAARSGVVGEYGWIALLEVCACVNDHEGQPRQLLGIGDPTPESKSSIEQGNAPEAGFAHQFLVLYRRQGFEPITYRT